MSFYIEVVKENETSAEIVHFLWNRKVIAWEGRRNLSSSRHKVIRVFEKDVGVLKKERDSGSRDFVVINDKEAEFLIPLISTCIDALDCYYNNDVSGIIKFQLRVMPELLKTKIGFRFISTSPCSSDSVYSVHGALADDFTPS